MLQKVLQLKHDLKDIFKIFLPFFLTKAKQNLFYLFL